jgi:hypothetical protein
MEKNCKAGEGDKFPGEEGKYYPETGNGASVEATSMAYLLYNHAAMWSIRIGSDPKEYAAKAKAIQTFINTNLWKESLNGYTDEGSNTVTAETIWPMALFASTPPKARAICDTYILKQNWFLTKHPMPLQKGDEAVENTYTYFAARGAWMFGRHNACLTLITESLIIDTNFHSERASGAYHARARISACAVALEYSFTQFMAESFGKIPAFVSRIETLS